MNLPDRDFVYNALVQENYFPTQKREREELPPVFSTQGLNRENRTLLEETSMRKAGYDQIIYKSTRFNNVSRLMSIPHPLPYIQLANCIAVNWDNLKFTAENKASRIKPKKHSDGRLIIMDYESTIEHARRTSKISFGKRFTVRTDISNCFPSVYSHSIPWAIVGMNDAKINKDGSLWYNKLDYHQRMLQRNETVGLPIGPATSNVIIESILAKVDKKLVDEGFIFSRDGEFSRYIDDYTAFCTSHTEAKKFITLLSDQLEQYKLMLNIKKTEILEQPTPLSPDWISELSTRISGTQTFNQIDAIRYLDFALSLLSTNPDGSVLKYVAKSLISKVAIGRTFLSYLLNLSFYYPILLPLFKTRLPDLDLLKPFRNELLEILGESIENKRSDGMAWTIYYLNALSFNIPFDLANRIVETEDCFAIALLNSSDEHSSVVQEFANGIVAKNDLYLIDRYWLLLYQLFFDGKISNPYSNEEAYRNLNIRNLSQSRANDVSIFENLKLSNVTFIV